MEYKSCMNARCRTASSTAWKKGWKLKSGGQAELCDSCGLAFELSQFCEKFHADDPGWRSCLSCAKRVHCGCVAALHLFTLLDTGGIACRECIELRRQQQELRENQALRRGNGEVVVMESADMVPEGTVPEVKKDQEENHQPSEVSPMEEDGTVKPDMTLRCMEEMGRFDDSADELAAHSNLNTALALGGPKVEDNGDGSSPFNTGGSVSGSESKGDSARLKPHQEQLLPQDTPASTTPLPETAKDTKATRTPVDSKGKNQMLPRYWPRITDQEIQQINSGDSNTVITPLFEKILSASDAGRIGRLVLPKACAEAYFPTISHAEGLPLKISDINGREWQFQFRFWPNNNSRMYVLEGVTPCIQAMRLQAGDTVTFSRSEPDGKLIMGYRKAQDSVDGEYNGHKVSTEHKAARARENQSTVSADKRRGRPLGAKTKRLRLDSEDSMDLKASWEEAQDLLRPPPGATPSLVTVDGHQFEEYEEPPVLTKKTVTRTQPSGEQDRWVQCDECSKFRKVPMEVLLHMKWTCVDNIWDPKRANCNASKELSNEEMSQLLESLGGTYKKSGVSADNPSGLDALANAAAIGDDKPTSPPPAPPATTRHPRHRPGCTCIVCIQPPSGKGPKHKSSCVCTVCLTVKRRFKTLMLKKKNREAENAAAKKKKGWDKDDPPVTPPPKKKSKENGKASQRYREPASSPPPLPVLPTPSPPPTAMMPLPTPQSAPLPGVNQFMSDRKMFTFPGILGTPFTPVLPSGESPSTKLDLNIQPEREDVRISMLRLLQSASQPLDLYLKQQGIASLVPPGPSGGGSGGGGGGAPSFGGVTSAASSHDRLVRSNEQQATQQQPSLQLQLQPHQQPQPGGVVLSPGNFPATET